MNKFAALALAAFAVALTPAMAGAASSKMMPTCKGRMVMVDTTTHVYSTNTHWKVTKHKMMVMCEAGAKAKGYHMMSAHMTTKKPAAPMVNPKGAMNSDKGATPNPDNAANGVHTTAAPAPTPTP